jgi:dTMP kinase
MQKERSKKGKLIVIDGTDGSGKATQMALLAERLRKAKYEVSLEDFPRYGKKSAGLVEEYLNGAYGTAKELGPYIPSLFYAVDRFAAKKEIENNLRAGNIVLSNRYTTASMGHQGGKIKDERERAKYFSWLQDLEFNFFGIPKPDLVILLSIPPKIAQGLIDKKSPRNYIANGFKRDMHEADLKHLQDAARTYEEMSRKFGYPLINCAKGKSVLPPAKISELVWKEVRKIL